MRVYECEFYRCSGEYVDMIHTSIRADIDSIIKKLPKRKYQNEINSNLLWMFGERGWSFSSFPSSFPNTPPSDLFLDNIDKKKLMPLRKKDECLVTSNLALSWYADFSKTFGSKRVFVEVQFGKIEALLEIFADLQ